MALPGGLGFQAATFAARAEGAAGPHEQVADLAGHPVGAAVDPAAEHPAAADPCAYGHVKQAVAVPGPRPSATRRSAATLPSLSTAAGTPNSACSISRNGRSSQPGT